MIKIRCDMYRTMVRPVAERDRHPSVSQRATEPEFPSVMPAPYSHFKPSNGLNLSSGLTGVVDVGSSKVVCVALAPGLDHRASDHGGATIGWAGVGVRPAEGLKCGEIVDTALAEIAIVGAIADAERTAGASLDHIILGVGCGRLITLQVDLAVSLDPAIVQAADIQRLRQGARTYAERDQRWSLFEELIGYRLDGQPFASGPVARFGRKLESTMTLVTADAAPVGRLVTTAERSGLPVSRLTPAPLASARAVTTEEERMGAITVVDLGAGFTSMVTYIGGRLARLDTVTLGGRQLTQDVAAALQIPFSSAERIKTECASVDPAHVVGSDAYTHRPGGGFIADRQPAAAGMSETRADLCDILSPRLEAMLRHVADHLDALPSAVADNGRLVLTGGGSLLAGLPGYAARLLGRRVRLGRPQVTPAQIPAGLSAAALAPLAAVAGLAEMAGRARHRANAQSRVRAA